MVGGVGVAIAVGVGVLGRLDHAFVDGPCDGRDVGRERSNEDPPACPPQRLDKRGDHDEQGGEGEEGRGVDLGAAVKDHGRGGGDQAEGEGAEDVGDGRPQDIASRKGGAALGDGGDDDDELVDVLITMRYHEKGQRTSSHSAPAVRSAIRVGGMRRRAATLAVWSTNLSAPNSRTKRPATKAAMLKQTLS